MIKEKNKIARQSAIVFVCDFPQGLALRVLDVYNFFRRHPRIILVRRTPQISIDRRLVLLSETIPLPMLTLERRDPLGRVLAITAALGYLLYSLVLYVRLRRIKANIRLVHAHYIFPQGLLGLLLARFLRVPLVVTASGTDVNLMMPSSSILRAACFFVLRNAYATVAVSKPLQNRLRQYQVPNCVYIPNSIDVDSIPPVKESNAETWLLFVGSMTENKQPFVMLRAFRRVLEQEPTTILIMCGDGPLRGAVEQEIRERNLQDNVKFFPRLSPMRLNEVRSRASVFVLPSLSEGLSLALLEALAAGQIVVASRNESHAAILEQGVNALLFEPGDSEQLAQQILLAISNKAVRSRISRAARHLCTTQFSSAVVANQVEDLYLRAISNHLTKVS